MKYVFDWQAFGGCLLILLLLPVAGAVVFMDTSIVLINSADFSILRFRLQGRKLCFPDLRSAL